MLDWDRTHDWVMHRIWHDLTRVTIHFRSARPSLSELAAIRRSLPQFRNMPPALARASIGETGQLPLGVLPTTEARRIIEIFQAEVFAVEAECASSFSYLTVDKTISCMWLIENAAEAKAVVQAMLVAGIPIQNVEA